MHAASVNPEPGSNSLKNAICSALRQRKSFFRGRFLASLTLEFLSGFLTRFLLALFVLSEFCCSIFKDRTAALPALRLSYYTNSSTVCQPPFYTFFDFFAFCLFNRSVRKKPHGAATFSADESSNAPARPEPRPLSAVPHRKAASSSLQDIPAEHPLRAGPCIFVTVL